MSFKTFFVLVCCAIFCRSELYAGREGTTGAQFLKIGAGARPAALGESFTGVSNDINSLFWNPAGLADLDSFQLTAGRAALYEDINYDFMAAGRNFGENWGTLGVAVDYLGMSKMSGYDSSGNPAPDYGANDRAIIFSYGRKFGPAVSIGGSAKLLRQQIDKETASGFAADFGGLYTKDKMSLGLAVHNIGPAMGFDEKFKLPAAITLGGAYKLGPNMLFSSDINYPFDYNPSFHLGGEYSYNDTLILRLGLRTTNIGALGMGSAVTAGFGIKIKKANFDYAVLPYGDLGLTHRFSVSLKM